MILHASCRVSLITNWKTESPILNVSRSRCWLTNYTVSRLKFCHSTIPKVIITERYSSSCLNLKKSSYNYRFVGCQYNQKPVVDYENISLPLLSGNIVYAHFCYSLIFPVSWLFEPMITPVWRVSTDRTLYEVSATNKSGLFFGAGQSTLLFSMY